MFFTTLSLYIQIICSVKYFCNIPAHYISQIKIRTMNTLDEVELASRVMLTGYIALR